MVSKSNLRFFGIFVLAVAVLSIYFVLADHVVTKSTGGTSFTAVDQYASNLYNITINNTDAGQDKNITEVNIILYGSLNFTAGTNGTDVAVSTFTNTTTLLNWSNSTEYLINGSEAKHFWFNLTATQPGSFKIGVQTFNATGPVNTTNLTVTVNGIVSGCGGALNVANITYTLNQSIGPGAGGDCLVIANESIILDCAGYNITFGNSTGGMGIMNLNVSGENGYANITIRNCNLYENSSGFNATAIFFGTDSENATIFNNTITTQGNETWGMFFDENLQSSNISSNTLAVSGNESYGIAVASGSGVSMDSNDITITGILSTGIFLMDAVTSSNVTLNDINISVSDPTSTTGIFLRGASNSNLLYNNTITTSGGGISIEDSTSTNISSNTVISSAFNLSSVYLFNASSSILENNNITTSDNLSSAIVLSGLINTLINSNDITTSNIEAIGILFENSNNSNITSNTITTLSKEAPGVYLGVDSDNMIVNSNIITTSGNESSGIQMGDNSTGGTIYNNTIVTGGNRTTADNVLGGIFLDTGTTANVSSNDITTSGVDGAGIWMMDGDNHSVDSNTIAASGELGDGIYMTDATGINLTSNTITISGVRGDGIFSRLSQNSSLLFDSNVITTTANYSYGIHLQSENYNNISSNNITTSGNASYGVYLNSSHHITWVGNIIKTGESDSYVLYLFTAQNHSVYNNIFNTSTSGSGVYFDSCSLNYFNTTNSTGPNIIRNSNIGGNFWTNVNANGYSDICTNLDNDYFCDSAYTVMATRSEVDSLPLANHDSWAPSCATLSTENKSYYLNQSISSNGTCFNITVNGITLDFNGFNITGNTTGYGVNVTGYNDTTILDGEIYNFSIGIYLKSNKDNNITNMTSNNNNLHGIALSTSLNNNLTAITASDNGGKGVILETSPNNIFADVTAYSNSHSGVYLGNSSSNTFTSFNVNYSRIYLGNSSSNTFTNINISNSSQDAILLQYANSDNNNFTNIVVTNTNSSYYDINFSTAGIDGTWISNINFAKYNFTGAGGKVIFEEPSFGKIEFLEAINGSGTSLSSDVDIENNSVFVNSSSNSGLNKSANISFYSVSFTGPIPQYSSDNVTWTNCTASTNPACVNFSYTKGGTFKFNVSHFTYFKIIEGYSAPAAAAVTEDDTVSSGSGGTPTYRPTEEKLEEGYTLTLKKNYKVEFDISGESHTLKVDSVESDSVKITVSSESQTKTLSVGDEAKFELDGDNVYDFSVKLESISLTSIGGNIAKLLMKSISEEIPAVSDDVTEDTVEDMISDDEKEISEEEEPSSSYWWWIGLIIALIVGAIIYFRKLHAPVYPLKRAKR